MSQCGQRDREYFHRTLGAHGSPDLGSGAESGGVCWGLRGADKQHSLLSLPEFRTLERWIQSQAGRTRNITITLVKLGSGFHNRLHAEIPETASLS